MDLSNMSNVELRELQQQIKQRLTEVEKAELNAAREQVMAIARKAGLSLRDPIFMKGKVTSVKQTRRRKQKDNATAGA